LILNDAEVMGVPVIFGRLRPWPLKTPRGEVIVKSLNVMPQDQQRQMDASIRLGGDGETVLNDDGLGKQSSEAHEFYTPEEIAALVGGITIKSLAEVIRNGRLETTTLGHLGPSPRGGRKRRVWGMTKRQMDALLALRNRRVDGEGNTGTSYG
jgi:hypothetical protein